MSNFAQPTRRMWLSSLAIATAVLAATPSIDAQVSLQRTGQVRVVGTPPLADGAVRAGLAWLPTRFVDNGGGSSTDQLTGLVWLQSFNLMASLDPGFDTDNIPGDGYVY